VRDRPSYQSSGNSPTAARKKGLDQSVAGPFCWLVARPNKEKRMLLPMPFAREPMFLAGASAPAASDCKWQL